MSDHARPRPATPTRPGPPASDATAENALRGPSRRFVLRVAGLAALTGGSVALAACSSDAGVAAPPATSSAPTSSAATSSAPTPSAPASSPVSSASPSAAASSAAPAPRGPSVATSKVPVGGGVILDDADYVITQPTKGDFKAFSKICTHQGCKVAEVSGGSINCPCHGSRFSIEDGSVVNPPARKPLPESKVTVTGGQVVVDA